MMRWVYDGTATSTTRILWLTPQRKSRVVLESSLSRTFSESSERTLSKGLSEMKLL